jgi:hypothetical protein
MHFNAEFNLIAINPILEFFSSDLVAAYCQGIESSMICTAPPIFVESLHGRLNTSPPRLPLHMHAEEMILTF